MDLKKDLFGRSEDDDFLPILNTNRFFDDVQLSSEIRYTANIINSIANVLDISSTVRNKCVYSQQLYDANTAAFFGHCVETMLVRKNGNFLRVNYSECLPLRSTIEKSMYNIILAESVAESISTAYPGYASLIRDYKKEKFGCTTQELKTDRGKLTEVITKMIRFPKEINEEDYKKFKKPLDELKQYIKETYNGVPSTEYNINSLAQYISNIITNYKDETEEEKASEDSTLPNPGLDDSSEIDIIDEILDYLKEQDCNVVNSDDSKITQELTDELRKIDYEKTGKTIERPVIFSKVTDSNITLYNDCLKKFNLSKASSLSKLLSRKNRDYQFTLKSMRSGKLDTNKLAEAKQRVETIYEHIGEVHTDKLCVCILADESGSMSTRGKINKAREAMIYLYELFKNNKDVELFIYGHTADTKERNTEIFVYKESAFFNKYSLGTAKARSNNRDGIAIYNVAKRIRTFTKRPAIMFVISDGQPAAISYDGREAIKHTKENVEFVEKKLNFQVIQIAIEASVPSKQMFNHYVTMTDIETLPSTLVQYVSEFVDKNIKTKITL